MTIQVLQAGLEHQNASLNAIVNKLTELPRNVVDVGVVEALKQEPNLVRDGGGELEHDEGKIEC